VNGSSTNTRLPFVPNGIAQPEENKISCIRSSTASVRGSKRRRRNGYIQSEEIETNSAVALRSLRQYPRDELSLAAFDRFFFLRLVRQRFHCFISPTALVYRFSVEWC
jgi:hypothetical protein